MDVHSLGTARRLERDRRQPSPLDAVIRVAKEAEEADKPVVEEEEIKQEMEAMGGNGLARLEDFSKRTFGLFDSLNKGVITD